MVTINNQNIEWQEKTTILQACNQLNINIPTFCHDDRLKPFGSCRICVVEVEGLKKLTTACTTLLKDGMNIQTHSERVIKARKSILELMWHVHDNDCLSCEKAGDCLLQDYCFEYGVDSFLSKYENQEDRYDTSNQFYIIDRDKCIQCGKCIRVCNELQGSFAIGFDQRSDSMYVTYPFGEGVENSDCVSCGNCVNVCPTGALMEKKNEKFRNWDIDYTERTTCVYCGVGCQIDLQVVNNKVVRIDPVVDAVNQGLLCVKGKFSYNFIHHKDRLTIPLIRKNGQLVEATWDEAYDLITKKIRSIKDTYGSDAFAGFSSAKCTNEDNYVIQKFFRAVLGTNNIDHCARL